jgi:hypothetical protein
MRSPGSLCTIFHETNYPTAFLFCIRRCCHSKGLCNKRKVMQPFLLLQ